MSLNKESIEKWEYHYFKLSTRAGCKLLEGLKSKDKI